MWVTTTDPVGSKHTFFCVKITMAKYHRGDWGSDEDKWNILFWTAHNTDRPEYIMSCTSKDEAEFKYSVFHAELTGGKFIDIPNEAVTVYCY